MAAFGARQCPSLFVLPLVLLSLSLSRFQRLDRPPTDRPTLDCAMQRQTCSPAALSIPLRYLDFVIILIIEHDSGKAVGGHRRQAFLLRPLFIGRMRERRQKTTLHMHQTDREGNEMFMQRRRGKTLTQRATTLWEQEMNEIKNRFPPN